MILQHIPELRRMVDIVDELHHVDPDLMLDRYKNTVEPTVNQAQARRTLALMLEFCCLYQQILWRMGFY